MGEYVQYTPAQLTDKYNRDLSTLLPSATYNEKGLPMDEPEATTQKFKDSRKVFEQEYKDDFFISKNTGMENIGKIRMLTTKGINGYPKGLLFMNGKKQYEIDIDKDANEPIIYRRVPQSKKRSHSDSPSHVSRQSKKNRSQSPSSFPPPSPRGGKKNRKTKRRKTARRNKKHLANQ